MEKKLSSRSCLKVEMEKKIYVLIEMATYSHCYCKLYSCSVFKKCCTEQTHSLFQESASKALFQVIEGSQVLFICKIQAVVTVENKSFQKELQNCVVLFLFILLLSLKLQYFPKFSVVPMQVI